MKTVLVVDDSQDIIDLIEIYLDSEFDFKVLKATSGKEALEILKTTEVFMVISDFQMPEGNGAYLYNNIGRNFYFTLICGDGDLALEKLENINPRTFTLLEKPFVRKDLIEVMNKALAPDKTPEINA